jgi:hypothetical protein
MHTRTTSVLEFASPRRSRSAIVARVGLAVAIACVPVTGAFAQKTQAPSPNNQQQGQAEGQGRPTGRLIVPVTGTLGTAAAPAKPTAAVEADITPAVTGSFAIQRFAQTTEGGVAAVGTLTLSFTDPASNKARTVITQGTMPLDRGNDTGTPDKQPQPGGVSPQASSPATAQGCETMSLLLGGVALDLPGHAIQLDDANVDLVPSAGERQGTPLCDVAGPMDGAPPAELVKALNTLLDTMG